MMAVSNEIWEGVVWNFVCSWISNMQAIPVWNVAYVWRKRKV